MEKVVVVVVVTIRDGSRGSGPRLDWENLSDARFLAASSLWEGMSLFGTCMQAAGIYARREGIVVRPEELLVRRQF